MPEGKPLKDSDHLFQDRRHKKSGERRLQKYAPACDGIMIRNLARDEPSSSVFLINLPEMFHSENVFAVCLCRAQANVETTRDFSFLFTRGNPAFIFPLKPDLAAEAA